MCTNHMQAKSLIASKPNPTYYELALDIKSISKDDILVLDGKEWLYAVVGSRGSNKELKNLKPVKAVLDEIASADIVIGKIADDRMMPAIRAFEKNILTDKALIACLSKNNDGLQVVAKTDFACSCIKIVSEHELTQKERCEAFAYAEAKKQEGQNAVQEARLRYQGDGLYLNEYI